MIVKDRNGKQLCVGVRVAFDTPKLSGEEFLGTVIELSGPENLWRVRTQWDDFIDPIWNPPNRISRLHNLDEGEILEFLSFTDRGPDLGKKFCHKFNITNKELSEEQCPGKAAKMIISVYVGDA